MDIGQTVASFLKIRSRAELAETLGISYNSLIYNLYLIPAEKKYKTFEIPKRRGGTRTIQAPASNIKLIQRRLADILQYDDLYKAKPCAHGYISGKSIKTNAIVHSRKRIIVNLDLNGFFPSINFGRVRGLFRAAPFGFPNEAATALAQICCHEGALPQGAPTSPVISNYICRRLDRQLTAFCAKNKMYYTRYADDITFSTNLHCLPTAVGTVENGVLTLSDELQGMIQGNGFTVNETKTRIAYGDRRQEVTGLVVNAGPNVLRTFVREVRAMLHAWEKFGLKAAAEKHFSNGGRSVSPETEQSAFKNRVTGKISYIGHIKGKDNPVYLKLVNRLWSLLPGPTILLGGKTAENLRNVLGSIMDMSLPFVYCEGKTDPIHLETALEWFHRRGDFPNLRVNFFPYSKSDSINNTELLKVCRISCLTAPNEHTVVCLFDRDEPHINASAADKGCDYKAWGNRVFSALLPKPPHRDFDQICIEHYYTDDDLRRKDKHGRRLYLSTEFDPETGRHLTEPLVYVKKSKLKAPYPKILDSDVINPNSGDQVAMSKNNFAHCVAKGWGEFANISFSNFRPVFELLGRIIKQAENEG